MKVLFEEFGLYARRRGLHTDKHMYDDFSSCLVEQASIKDDEKAARGALKQMEEVREEPAEFDQGQWVTEPFGNTAWIEAAQLNALAKGATSKGKWKTCKGKGKRNRDGKGFGKSAFIGKCYWCGRDHDTVNDCEGKTNYFKEKGWGRQAPQAAAIASAADGQSEPIERAPQMPTWMINIQKLEGTNGSANVACGQFKSLQAIGNEGPRTETPLSDFVVDKSWRTKRNERKHDYERQTGESCAGLMLVRRRDQIIPEAGALQIREVSIASWIQDQAHS